MSQADLTAVRPAIEAPQIRVLGRRGPIEAKEATLTEPAPWGLSTWFIDLAPICFGVLCIASAYACSRTGRPGGTALYWLGQGAILAPAAWRLLGRRTSSRSRLTILVGMAAAQSFLVWAYSPDMFRFPDEFEHVRTLSNILASGHLFAPNSTLPQSPAFPGLEIATDALMKTAGLSMFAAGHIIVASSHALLPVFMFLAYRELSGDDRTASVAALLYSFAPHYSYFEVLFIYSTPALTYLALTFATALRVARRKLNPLWVIPAFLPALFSHHLTAFAGIALLAAISVVTAFSRHGAAGRGLLVVTIFLAALTAVWTAIRAPSTFAYLGQPLISAFETITNVKSSHSSGGSVNLASVGEQAPRWESLAEILAAGLILVLSYAGIVLGWWSNVQRRTKLVISLGCLYPVILLIRVFAPDGTELSIRALTYAMIVIAYPLALMIETIVDLRPRIRGRIIGFAAAGLVGLGAILSGLPPAWERLPGKYHVDSDEAGIDAQLAAIGPWAAVAIPRNAPVACGFSACSIFSGSTNASLTTQAAKVYYAKSLTAMDRGIADLGLDYLQTDQRWSTQTSKVGGYFPGDEREGRFPRRLLNRLDQNNLLDRVYDSGAEHVYDTFWVWNS